MESGFATSARRAISFLARRTPVLGGVFRRADELRAANAALRAENAALRAANAALTAERDHALALHLASDDERDRAEKARWDAVREREKAEEARWAAVAEREIAERNRWAAVRQREEADAALRQALVGGFPRREAPAQRPVPKPPQSAKASAAAHPAAKLNGGNPGVVQGAKISIVLPNYNHGAFIKDNIEGVRAQTYPNWELVIVDDGSTDDSRAIIQSFAELDRRIVPIFLPENRGAMFATQTALAAATGELLYGSAADDYLANERFFELVIASLAEHPEAAGAFGKAIVVDLASGKELWRMGSAPVKELVSPERALEAFLMGGMFVPGTAAIWKRSLIDSLGGFDPTLGPQTDFFLNHALPIMAGAVFVDEVFAVVRAGAGNYHRSGTEEEFFRRHALVETKLRALNLPMPLDPIWLRIWRDRLINSRLAVTRQQQIYASLRGTLTSIETWERDGLPQGFDECSSRLLADIGRWESELEKQVSSAHRAFDTYAGPLGLEGESQGAQQS
jgi:glycosyltransferase involved in cell wall biosynthesis